MKIKLHDVEISAVMTDLAEWGMPGVRLLEAKDFDEKKPRSTVKKLKTRSAFLEEALREWDVAMGWGDLADETLVPNK